VIEAVVLLFNLSIEFFASLKEEEHYVYGKKTSVSSNYELLFSQNLSEQHYCKQIGIQRAR
jgi:hypothetical protein